MSLPEQNNTRKGRVYKMYKRYKMYKMYEMYEMYKMYKNNTQLEFEFDLHYHNSR